VLHRRARKLQRIVIPLALVLLGVAIWQGTVGHALVTLVGVAAGGVLAWAIISRARRSPRT
jgi:hypothetical protein